jgi:gamma-tubulin complex component 5
VKNPEPPKNGPTWKEILDEEPFEGQHWEGVYGLPPGSTAEGWETQSLASTPPLSPVSFEDLAALHSSSLDRASSAEPENDLMESAPSSAEKRTHTPLFYDHRQDVETLKAKQYWRKEWRIPCSPNLESDFKLS